MNYADYAWVYAKQDAKSMNEPQSYKLHNSCKLLNEACIEVPTYEMVAGKFKEEQ